jgi:hypothetical protein
MSNEELQFKLLGVKDSLYAQTCRYNKLISCIKNIMEGMEIDTNKLNSLSNSTLQTIILNYNDMFTDISKLIKNTQEVK